MGARSRRTCQRCPRFVAAGVEVCGRCCGAGHAVAVVVVEKVREVAAPVRAVPKRGVQLALFEECS